MSIINDEVLISSPFTEEMLDNFRQQGDPLADEVIDAFAAQYNSSIQEFAEKLENMIRMPSDDKVIDAIQKYFSDDENIQHALEKFFIQATSLPKWINTEKLELGSHVFQDHLFSGIMILGCASLPTTYVCQPDTKVLGFTRRLIDDAPKRLVETAQMVTDVMGEGGLTIQSGKLAGKGIQSILKIRLIHAAVRHMMLHKEKILADHQHDNNIDPNNFLLAYVFDSCQEQSSWYGTQRPDPWYVKTDGVPINKEALAIILLTFSFTILRGLKKIGVRINKEQRDAYLHSWNIVGYTLGVDERLLAEFSSYEKTKVIYTQIMSRRRGYSNDGKLLQQSLLEAFAENAKRLIPFGRLLHVRRLARLITSILISKESYKALGLKLSLYDYIVRFFIWLGVRLFGFLVNFKLFRPLANYMFGRIAQSLWDWRKEYDNNDERYEKIAILKPLVIPCKLVPTSYLSGKYNS